MDDITRTARVLGDLTALGVKLAIDDFGTGHSSLNYLQRLPIDILKIDRSFVTGIEKGGDELALTRTICDLARSLSLTTIAEGIEHPAQAFRLRELGCDLAQGFLYSTPLPARHIHGLLAEANALRHAS
jgi:EAL domain-containing protein (putative c-di-GMP-specific phosphodiesterase class I)